MTIMVKNSWTVMLNKPSVQCRGCRLLMDSQLAMSSLWMRQCESVSTWWVVNVDLWIPTRSYRCVYRAWMMSRWMWMVLNEKLLWFDDANRWWTWGLLSILDSPGCHWAPHGSPPVAGGKQPLCTNCSSTEWIDTFKPCVLWEAITLQQPRPNWLGINISITAVDE